MSSKDDAAMDAAGIRGATKTEIALGDCCMYCQHLVDDDARTVDEDKHCFCLKHGLYVWEMWTCSWMRGERNA